MNKEMLKTFRLIIPGILIVLFLLPIYQRELSIESLNKIKIIFDSRIIIILGIVIGTLYYILNFRSWFFSKPVKKINDNIKYKLLKMCDNNPLILNKNKSLTTGRTLMIIFYRIIDNDESLKDIAKSVRLNGLIWSSIADVKATSLIVSFIYLILSWMSFKWLYFICGLALITTHIIAFFLMSLVTQKQLSLSNEQLENINLHHIKEVNNLIEDAAERLPNDDQQA